jgi:predicted N-acyltransferase
MSFKIRDQNFKKMKTWWPNLHLSLFDIKRWNGKESMRFLWGDIDQTRKLHLINPEVCYLQKIDEAMKQNLFLFKFGKFSVL